VAQTRLAQLQQWITSRIEDAVRALHKECACKPRTVFMTLRVAVTGATASPPLFESMEVLGRDRSLTFIRNAADRLREP
jgi:glutamyl-tRNA synthetase